MLLHAEKIEKLVIKSNLWPNRLALHVLRQVGVVRMTHTFGSIYRVGIYFFPQWQIKYNTTHLKTLKYISCLSIHLNFNLNVTSWVIHSWKQRLNVTPIVLTVLTVKCKNIIISQTMAALLAAADVTAALATCSGTNYTSLSTKISRSNFSSLQTYYVRLCFNCVFHKVLVV